MFLRRGNHVKGPLLKERICSPVAPVRIETNVKELNSTIYNANMSAFQNCDAANIKWFTVL